MVLIVILVLTLTIEFPSFGSIIWILFNHENKELLNLRGRTTRRVLIKLIPQYSVKTKCHLSLPKSLPQNPFPLILPCSSLLHFTLPFLLPCFSLPHFPLSLLLSCSLSLSQATSSSRVHPSKSSTTIPVEPPPSSTPHTNVLHLWKNLNMKGDIGYLKITQFRAVCLNEPAPQDVGTCFILFFLYLFSLLIVMKWGKIICVKSLGSWDFYTESLTPKRNMLVWIFSGDLIW